MLHPWQYSDCSLGMRTGIYKEETHRRRKQVNALAQLVNPVHGNYFFISIINVQDVCLLLELINTSYYCSVPGLQGKEATLGFKTQFYNPDLRSHQPREQVSKRFLFQTLQAFKNSTSVEEISLKQSSQDNSELFQPRGLSHTSAPHRGAAEKASKQCSHLGRKQQRLLGQSREE